MRPHQWLVLLLALIVLLGSCDRRAFGHDTIDPRAQPNPVQVTLDTSEVPELRAWGETAKRLIEQWYPIIAGLLQSDGFHPPSAIKLVFKKGMKGVAATSGATITVAADWVKHHPDDFGMVIHELTHVIQGYPPSKDGWLVEGIADYIRYFHYEPETKLPLIDPARASYRDSYKTTAQFLAWVERTYDTTIVSTLNQALRRSRYQDRLWEDATGKSLDKLWAEFIKGPATAGRRARGPAPRTEVVKRRRRGAGTEARHRP